MKIDEMALHYFDNPNDFAEGMKLLFKLAQKKQRSELEYPESDELLNLGLEDNISKDDVRVRESGVSNFYKANPFSCYPNISL